MPTYILMSTLTPEGCQTLHKGPDRLDQVSKEITDFGRKVVAQYAVLGQCDFITVVRLARLEDSTPFARWLRAACDTPGSWIGRGCAVPASRGMEFHGIVAWSSAVKPRNSLELRHDGFVNSAQRAQ